MLESGSDGPTIQFIVPLHPDKGNSRGVNEEYFECKMINDARTGAWARRSGPVSVERGQLIVSLSP